jgi:hypothetical protein
MAARRCWLQLCFESNAHGKPRLVTQPPDQRLQFNLCHTDSLLGAWRRPGARGMLPT